MFLRWLLQMTVKYIATKHGLNIYVMSFVMREITKDTFLILLLLNMTWEDKVLAHFTIMRAQ